MDRTLLDLLAEMEDAGRWRDDPDYLLELIDEASYRLRLLRAGLEAPEDRVVEER